MMKLRKINRKMIASIKAKSYGQYFSKNSFRKLWRPFHSQGPLTDRAPQILIFSSKRIILPSQLFQLAIILFQHQGALEEHFLILFLPLWWPLHLNIELFDPGGLHSLLAFGVVLTRVVLCLVVIVAVKIGRVLLVYLMVEMDVLLLMVMIRAATITRNPQRPTTLFLLLFLQSYAWVVLL